jgi:hypothetical protein
MDGRKAGWAHKASRKASVMFDRLTSMDGTIVVDEINSEEEERILREQTNVSITQLD